MRTVNNKQKVWVSFLVLEVLCLVFKVTWGLLLPLIVLMVGTSVFCVLMVGYFSYVFYRHLGDDPLDFVGPDNLVLWYRTMVSQFIEKGEEEND